MNVPLIVGICTCLLLLAAAQALTEQRPNVPEMLRVESPPPESDDRPLPNGHVILVVALHLVDRDRWVFAKYIYPEWPACFARALWYVMQSTTRLQYHATCEEADKSLA